MRFLGYIVFYQDIRMEKERIKAIYDWCEPLSVCDIQIFLEFANFNRQFIQGFNRIAVSLSSMLKIASLVDLAISVKVDNEEQDDKSI